jgi:hypothetical protein
VGDGLRDERVFVGRGEEEEEPAEIGLLMALFGFWHERLVKPF